jgi:hypothetical protein
VRYKRYTRCSAVEGGHATWRRKGAVYAKKMAMYVYEGQWKAGKYHGQRMIVHEDGSLVCYEGPITRQANGMGKEILCIQMAAWMRGAEAVDGGCIRIWCGSTSYVLLRCLCIVRYTFGCYEYGISWRAILAISEEATKLAEEGGRKPSTSNGEW